MKGSVDDASLVITLRETNTSAHKNDSEGSITEDPHVALQYGSAEQIRDDKALEMPTVMVLKMENMVLLTMVLTLWLTCCFDIVADRGF